MLRSASSRPCGRETRADGTGGAVSGGAGASVGPGAPLAAATVVSEPLRSGPRVPLPVAPQRFRPGGWAARRGSESSALLSHVLEPPGETESGSPRARGGVKAAGGPAPRRPRVPRGLPRVPAGRSERVTALRHLPGRAAPDGCSPFLFFFLYFGFSRAGDLTALGGTSTGVTEMLTHASLLIDCWIFAAGPTASRGLLSLVRRSASVHCAAHSFHTFLYKNSASPALEALGNGFRFICPRSLAGLNPGTAVPPCSTGG